MLACLLLTIPLFTPPPSWHLAQTKNPSSYVKVSFAANEGASFRPSMNLATEEVDVSLKEYVKAVKEINLKEPNTTWRDLGKFEMKAGTGRLSEISAKTPHGEVKTLQAFLVHERTAYILTATTLKKDLSSLQEKILASFRSFSLEDSLFEAIKDQERQQKIKRLFVGLGDFPPEADVSLGKQKQWEMLQRDVVDEFPEMGGYWHFLTLKEGLSKIQGIR